MGNGADSPEIHVGDTWTLISGLGTGVGALPAGAEVVISVVLPPFSPGVAQVDETTVISTYTYMDWVYDDDGNLVEEETSRLLAYPESSFRLLFAPPGGD